MYFEVYSLIKAFLALWVSGIEKVTSQPESCFAHRKANRPGDVYKSDQVFSWLLF